MLTIQLDILAWFRALVASGGNYQTLINDALRAHFREELHSV